MLQTLFLFLTYRYLINMLGDLFSLSFLVFCELLSDMSIIEPNSFSNTDANLTWVATVSNNMKGNFLMPERGMVRFTYFSLLSN